MTTPESSNYIRTLRSRLAAWEHTIDRMRSRAAGMRPEFQVDYFETLEDLEVMRTRVEDRLRDLAEAPEHDWTEQRRCTEKAWDRFEAVALTAKARFASHPPELRPG